MTLKHPFNVMRHADWDAAPRMPQAIGAAIAAVFPAATAGAFTFAIGGVATTVSYATILGYVAYSALTSAALRALAPKATAQNKGTLINAREAAAPQEYVYGQVRKGGVITFLEESGGNNKYLHMILTLAGHEVEEIGSVYINDEVVSIDSNGFVTGDRWKSKVRIYKHLGNQTSASTNFDNVSTNLAATLHTDTSATSNFVGQGIAYIYARFEYDQDVFGGGLPTITAVVKGKKVYDPRGATTGYSNNAALCVRDYLTSAYGLNDSTVDDTYFAAAANDCDDNITLSAGGTQKRYTVDGVINSSSPIGAALADMLDALNGTLFFSGGAWKLKAGVYEASVKSLTLDDFRSAITLPTRLSRRDNFNRVTGKFIYGGVYDESTNPSAGDWIETDFPAIESAAFLTEDNSIDNTLDIVLTMVTNSDRAQRIAKQKLFRSREQMTVSAEFGLSAMGIEVGDVIDLTISKYGWTNKEFEVVNWRLVISDTGGVRIAMTLRETSSAAFAWDAEETAIISNNTTLTDAFSVAAPTGFLLASTVSVNDDGSSVPAINASWTGSSDEFVVSYELQYKKSTDLEYISTIGTSATFTVQPVNNSVTYQFRVRAINGVGVHSDWVNSSIGSSADGTIPNPPTVVTVAGGYGSTLVTWTAPTQNTDTSTLKDLFQYKIYRGTSIDPTTLVGRVSGEIFTDNGLADETTYYYRIKAVDFTGNESAYSANGSATTNPQLQDGAEGPAGPDGATGAPGASGDRGAGWWRYVDTTNASTYYDTDTQSRVNAAFSTAVGLAIVEGDRFIISCTDDTAIAFIYSSGSWVAQEAFVDGNLLVDGTITGQKVAAATIESDKISVGSLSAITATMGQLDVTDFIRIDTEGAAFLAGRDGSSDISQDGFYIGRETFNGGLGFEVSHISEDENGDISGIIHNNNGFKVYNPKLTTGGSFSSTNVYLYSNGSSHNLGSGLTEVTFTAIGAGGGGGNSFANGSSAETLSNAGADVYFDSLTGWTTAAGTPIVAGGYLEIQNAEIRRSFTTTSGRSYVLILDHFTASSNVTINIGTTDGGSEVASYVLSNETYQTELRRAFVSTAGTLYLSIDDNSTTGQKTMMDTIHVHETNYHGGDTTVKVWAGSVGGTLIATKTSLGGPGGRTALPSAWGGTINSEAGQNSTWGDGGPAVDRNTDGANATGYSAGGGGAGGDNYDLFDNQLGYAGKGGRKGSETTFLVDTSAHVGSDIIIEADVVGAGGAVGTLHTWQGGSGSPGFVIVQSPIGQTIEYSIGNLVPKFTPIATQTLASSAIAATYTWTDLSAYEIISVEYNMTLDVASSVTIEARQTGGTWRTLRTQSTTTSDDTAYMKFDIMYFNSTHRKAFYVLSAEISNNDLSGSTGGAATSERYMPWNSTGTANAFSEIRVTHPALDPINGDTWNSYIRISGAKKANGQFPWSID